MQLLLQDLLHLLKVLVQVGSGSSKQLTGADVLNRVRTLSGSSGLYSGVGWLTLGRSLGLGARFGVYEILTAFYKDGREDKYVYVSEALLEGIASGAVESLVRSPFELIKLRAQVTSASQIPSSASVVEKAVVSPLMAKLLPGYSGNIRALNNTVGLLTTLPTKHSNLVTALKDYPWMMTGSGRPQSVSDVKRLLDIISLEGWGAFWRGMRSGLARDCVFGGIFFSTWQFLHQAMLERKAVGMNTPPSMYPWRGGFLNGNRPERDLRDGPGSTLQIGISYFVAYDCGWHGVELHPLWLSVVIFLQLTDCFLREGNKDVRGIEELSKPGVIRKKHIFFSLEQAWRKLSHINVG